MAIKQPKPEEIVLKLRQVEVLMGQGMPRIAAIRQISVTETNARILQGHAFLREPKAPLTHVNMRKRGSA